MNRNISCIQRAFFVLSLMAIPIGLGTIVGGVLIVVSVDGHAAAASGAAVILIGLCAATIPPVVSFKIFHLQIKMFEGKLIITKSYGDFVDNPKRPGTNLKPDFYDIGDHVYYTADGPSYRTHARKQYLPEERVTERQTGMEESSTSFPGHVDYGRGITEENNSPRPIATNEIFMRQTEASSMNETGRQFSGDKQEAIKPPKQKKGGDLRGPFGGYDVL